VEVAAPPIDMATTPRHDSRNAAGAFWAPGLSMGRRALKPNPARSLLPECRCCETIAPSESGGSDVIARTGTNSSVPAITAGAAGGPRTGTGSTT
jgi:hypothetical protein